MKAKQLLIICGTSGAALCGCNTTSDGVAHFTDSDKDLSVLIGDDFYQHTNGGWREQHPLPADKSRIGTFDILHDETQERLKAIVEDVIKQNNENGTPAQKIADLYLCGLDTTQRNADGTKALQPYFDLIDAADTDEDLARLVGELNKMGSYPFFALYPDADAENSDMNIAGLWQAGLGLPDRDYYFNDDDEYNKKIIDGYINMITKFATMLGLDNSSERMQAVYNFEKRLAEPMNTRAENRNPQGIFNKTDLNGLKEKATGFDWDTFFATVGLEAKDINISQPKYFSQVGDIIATTDKNVVKDYLRTLVIRSNASYLTTEYGLVAFEYYGKTLSGTQELRPLWKRVLGVVEGALGEQLGQLFVEKHFPPQAKQRMVELIENLRTAFGERIDKLTWMGDSTKIQAKDKLAAITVKVGYPDKWTDYSKLTIDKSLGYMGNIINSNKFDHAREIDKINKPVDKTEWHMTPQTVNAYYNPSANEIVFPAGILQPPFFYANGDDAVNYGAIGVVIGHEITHGFDDQGSQYDKKGNLNNWWTKEDAERFKAATTRLAERYSSFVVIGDLHANGELTLGENIADLGGLNIAYQAFRNATNGVEPKAIDGQTADQRFCYAYSRIWAGNSRDEALYQQVKTDPHSPAKLRVNVPLPLVDYFYTAFNIDENSKMFVPKEDRIVIW